MKAVLMSIKPYWVFLIIAKAMDWSIGEEKTIEVRKSYPKDENWDKVVKLYCSKDKKSFAKIPKEYQPLMQQFLGKVIGEFVCDEITKFYPTTDLKQLTSSHVQMVDKSCVIMTDLFEYANGKPLYAWHISDLVIYDKPKELSEFSSGSSKLEFSDTEDGFPLKWSGITRPPQSWCYVEEMG